MPKIKFLGGLVAITVLLNFILVGPVLGKPSAEGEGSDNFKIAQEEFKGKLVPIVSDEVLVKFKGDHKPFRVMKVEPGQVKEKITEYQGRSDVEYAEPNYIAEAQMIPNDPRYADQWHFHSGPGGINLEDAWDLSTGQGVVVAVVDTGIAYENYGDYTQASDLAETCFIPGYDFVNEDEHANDDKGHGTHVAGTVAQSTDNDLGVAGIAYDACLMPVKVLDNYGYGGYADVASGIIYAADHGADVINLSLGGTSASQILHDAVTYAQEKDIVIVASAGNAGTNTLKYPAAYPEVIGVGATRYDETLAYYSNYGPDLDLVAPGGDVTVDQNGDGKPDGVLQQTFEKIFFFLPPFWDYYYYQGTSMASPHVAGTVALMKAADNDLSPEDIRTVLHNTVRDLGDPGKDDLYGWGLLDAYAAVNTIYVPNNPPVAQDQTVTLGEDNLMEITLVATDADGDSLTYTVLTPPEHGVLSGEAPDLIYSPNQDFNGPDAFTFQVEDWKDQSNIATVSITVNPVNDPPVAQAGEDQVVQVGETVSFDGSESFDPDGLEDIESYEWDFGDGVTDTGQTISHTYQAVGTYLGALIVRDAAGESSQDSLEIQVLPYNHPPVAHDQLVETDEDNAQEIALQASDEDGDGLTFSIVSEPEHGVLIGDPPNLTYTPDQDYAGVDYFTFKANDGYQDSNEATVNITVNPVNDPPIAQAGEDQSSSIDQVLVFDGSYSTDPDGPEDIESYQWNFGDGVTDTGTIVSHAFSETGVYIVTLTVTDREGAIAQDTLEVTISEHDSSVIYINDITLVEEMEVYFGFLKYYRVHAYVEIFDGAGNPVPGATVNATWSGRHNKTVSLTTNSEGIAIDKTYWYYGGSFTFTVNNVSKEGMIYDPSLNLETSESITVPSGSSSSLGRRPFSLPQGLGSKANPLLSR